MMGSLNADSHEITWVLTSYMVSSGLTILLTGFLVGRFGRKRLLLVNIAGFMISSVLCGISTSLVEMILFRILQGVFGASLVPLSQYILRDTFPRDQMNMAMGIWGLGIMLAPILGPIVGGLITDNMDWRWVFFINAPVCVLAYAIVCPDF